MTPIIKLIDGLMTKRRDDIEDWLHACRAAKRPFFYSSVDLRHSGTKLAPVDTNLFPAGFNNLSNAARHRTIRLMKERFAEMEHKPQRVLIIPENHTRNLAYLENLATLAGLLEKSGVEVKIGNVSITEPLQLTSMNGNAVIELPVKQENNRLKTADGFDPDLIILNNDCTSGVPPVLEHIRQPVEPDYKMGWYIRRKSEHFRVYAEIARDFARDFGFDPWLISGVFNRCGIVNFRDTKGIERVAQGVEQVLSVTREKYKEYGLNEKPYAFIKADSGTYGMGIMTVESGEELMDLNKKTRNKMNIIKEGTQNTEVIIQEGIPTIDNVENAPAEPMMYLLDGIPVGGAYRVNTERDAMSNLNASGMRFVGMCDEGECGEHAKEKVKVPNCNFSVFGLIATLATLAAGNEVYDSLDIGFSI